MAMEEYGTEPAEAGPRETEAALRRLADVALLPGSLTSPQERSILDSVLAYAVARLDATMRLRLAERLAPQADAPRELALALALDDIDHRTTILILGDARSNYGDPRGDILKKIHARARRVIWLNPEPRTMWNSGDSEMRRLSP